MGLMNVGTRAERVLILEYIRIIVTMIRTINATSVAIK